MVTMRTKTKKDKSGSVYTFDDGRIIRVRYNGKGQRESATLEIPAKDGVGPMLFPLRFWGDAVVALAQGQDLPEQCKGW